ncbi:MAG: transglutaminase-like domain-containing protein [Anaerolineaceae bacterium]
MFKKYQKNGFDLLSSFSLLLMVFLSAYSLESTHWTEDLNLVTSLACIGVILGIALGVTSFLKKQIIFLSILYSLVILFLFLIVMPSGSDSWTESWPIIQGRIMNALQVLQQGMPVPDNILFILSTGILYWAISLWAGVALIRKNNPWVPLGLLAGSLVATQFFQPIVYRSALLSGVFFFLFLFLLGHLNFLNAHRRWTERKAYEDQESSAVFLQTTTVISIVLIILAWGIPFLVDVATPGTKQHKAFIQTIEERGDFFSDFFSSFKTQPVQKETVFGDTFQLGAAQPLGEDILFTAIAPTSNFIDGNYYWKARSYSNYEDGTWSSIDVEGQAIEKNTLIESERAAENEVGKFVVVVNSELNYYYLPGNTIRINRSARITEMFTDTEDYDVIAWKPLLPLEEKDSYQSESYFIPLTYETLQAAGDDYPARVKRVYLQLPEDFSERIQTLAEAITAGLDSDFEKVLAITDYLRSQMNYTTEIENTPQNLDPVFWFLFENKSGYCNYYASAEVLLLRSIGIPARLAVGYAQGREVENNKIFEVRSKDSHAWVEVYFPDIGWVIFEPTSTQPAVHFPFESSELAEKEATELEQGNQSIPNSKRDDLAGANSASWYDAIEERLAGQEGLYDFGVEETSRNWYTPLLITIALVGVLAFLFFGRVKQRGATVPLQEFLVHSLEKTGRKPPLWLKNWANYRKLTYLQQNFSQFDFILRKFGVKELSQRTPLEKAKLLQEFIPEAKMEIEQIVIAYQQEVFGSPPVVETDMRKNFRLLRKKALHAIFFHQFNRLWKKSSNR